MDAPTITIGKFPATLQPCPGLLALAILRDQSQLVVEEKWTPLALALGCILVSIVLALNAGAYLVKEAAERRQQEADRERHQPHRDQRSPPDAARSEPRKLEPFSYRMSSMRQWRPSTSFALTSTWVGAPRTTRLTRASA